MDDYKCKSTVIHGYQVELELFKENGDDRSDCSVVKRVNGADFGGSLEMLNGFHTLEDHITGDEVPVPDSVRTAITDWAEANGY
tara:strand:- start:268 stop:519 length:252 start_codon:yes stop_codon:yes gene_type:complete